MRTARANLTAPQHQVAEVKAASKKAVMKLACEAAAIQMGAVDGLCMLFDPMLGTMMCN